MVLTTFSTTIFSVTFMSGNELHQYMNSDSITKNSIGLGYIEGVVDTKFPNCFLKGVTLGQLEDSVKLFLQNNPEIRQYTASGLVEKVVREKYGCKN